MSEDNKLVSILGGKKKEVPELLEHVRVTYIDGDVEVLNSDSWGSSEQFENFAVFFLTLDNDLEKLVGFRNLSLIKKIDICDKDGNNV